MICITGMWNPETLCRCSPTLWPPHLVSSPNQTSLEEGRKAGWVFGDAALCGWHRLKEKQLSRWDGRTCTKTACRSVRKYYVRLRGGTSECIKYFTSPPVSCNSDVSSKKWENGTSKKTGQTDRQTFAGSRLVTVETFDPDKLWGNGVNVSSQVTDPQELIVRILASTGV